MDRRLTPGAESWSEKTWRCDHPDAIRIGQTLTDETNLRDRDMPGAEELPEADLIEVEPKTHGDVLEPWTHGAISPAAGGQAGPDVASAQKSMASLREKTHSLRRIRIAAAAMFLALTFGVLFVAAWFGIGFGVSSWFARSTVAMRFVIAAVVASLLLSRLSLTGVQVRLCEYFLFGSFTIIMAVTLYHVSLTHLRNENLLGVTTAVKNGVFSMIVLMVCYGMFIPNDPRSAATVVLSMGLVYSVVLVFALTNPAVAHVVERMHTTELVGSNILFVMIGAAMAIYGAFVLNGLRTQLHVARRFGQYQLGRKLGEGGMGEVYLAEHKLLKRPCAVKLIKAAKTTPITLARFEREVQSAARLSHPNTIEIYDYGHTEDGTCYYVMEYLRGMSLADLIKDFGPIPAGRLIYLIRQVCAGLAEAHDLGLVHRDLKPANVFVAVRGGDSDVVKVLDFGLVKLTQDPGAVELSSDQTVSGTPLFMAPEQIIGDRALDGRADIYALGVVMYAALTGKLPFAAETPFAVMMAHVRDPVTAPGQIRSDLPADLEAVVLRCLAKKPDDRYPTVKALREALAACTSAADWGPNRADAWWATIGITALEDGT
jgi:eukaryotic-like serine/threonine-protein kinase